MATTPTANAVPSNDVADLLFNAEKLDEVINSSALTYDDRLGVERMTVAGAVATLATLNPRGDWATATAYAVKDLAKESGTWYLCVAPHTAGATFAGDAANWIVWQGGVTVADLADNTSTSKGGWLVGWFHSFANAIGRTLGARNRDTLHLSDAGTTADMLTALNRIFAGYPNGFKCEIEAGTWTLSAGVTFTGQRANLHGKGEQVTIIDFQPAGTAAAITYNNPALGGMYQTGIKGLGFTGGANTQVKTAVRMVNVANFELTNIGIASGAWLGASIGIKTEGRQNGWIHHNTIACARPVVVGNNVSYPTISSDHFVIYHNELIGTSATGQIVEFENGTSFGNTTIEKLACVGGQHGIYWNDTTSTSAGFCLKIADFRSEQGLDSAAYSIYLASTAQALQNVIIDNALLDSARNGVYLRNCQRVTLRNVTLNMTSGTAFDMTFVAGSRLIMENVQKQAGSAFTLTNARCVRRERVADVGMVEEWVYDSGFSAGGIASDVYHGGVQFSVASGATTPIADNTFCGLISVTSSEDSTALFELRGPTNQARELLDNAGVYSQTAGTATSVNIYWDAGSSRYLLQNNRASTLTFSIFRIGSVI